MFASDMAELSDQTQDNITLLDVFFQTPEMNKLRQKRKHYLIASYGAAHV